MANDGPRRDASRRVLAVFLTGVTLLAVILGAGFVFLATVIWSRDLDVRSAADEVVVPAPDDLAGPDADSASRAGDGATPAVTEQETRDE